MTCSCVRTTMECKYPENESNHIWIPVHPGSPEAYGKSNGSYTREGCYYTEMVSFPMPSHITVTSGEHPEQECYLYEHFRHYPV